LFVNFNAKAADPTIKKLGYEIVICNNCLLSQMESMVYSATTTRGKVVVVNLTTGLARAYRRFVETEPGFTWDDVWEIPVPTDFTEGLEQYMTLTNNIQGNAQRWNYVPRHLSPNGKNYASPSSPLSDPFIPPANIATTVRQLFDGTHAAAKQIEIAQLIKIQYMPNILHQVKPSFMALVMKQPIEVAVLFIDGSSVNFAYAGGSLSSIGFKMLAATALDKNKQPIYQTPPNSGSITGGGNDRGRYSGDKDVFGITIHQSCKTYWTKSSGSNWVSQVLCIHTQTR